MRRCFVKQSCLIGLVLLCTIFCGYDAILSAQEKAPTESAQKKGSIALDPATIEGKLRDVKQRVQQAEKNENEETARRLGVSLSDLQERRAKLQDIQTNYQRFVTALKKRESLVKEERLLHEKMKGFEKGDIAQKPPFSLSYYDNLLDQQGTLDQQRETVNLAILLARKALESTEERLGQAEKDVRRFKEGVHTAKTDTDALKLRWSLGNSEREKELQQVTFSFQKIHLENLSKELELAKLRDDMAQRNIRWVRSKLHFDEEDLEKRLTVLKDEKDKFQKKYHTINKQQSRIQAAWLDAQQKASTASSEKDIALSNATLHAKGEWRETYQKILEQTEDILQLLGHQEQIWKYRYAIVKGGIEAGQLDDWEEETKKSLKNIETKIQLFQRQQTDWQSQMVSLEKKASNAALDKEIRNRVREQVAALTKLAERGIDYLSVLLGSRQLHQRLLEEIATKRAHTPFSERIMNATGKLLSVWNSELWAIGEHSVTVKKLFSALLILIIGIIAVKYSIRILKKRLLPRVSLEAGAVAAFEKIFYYFSILVIVLVALRMVNIPLTAFTFLGGAIAIGVGFGAQNLINNFISGFIIMAERPIKIGDLIQIEENFAVVEEIGARCTRIRTGSNVHILVPNSSFLEKKITNWTLSDKMVRAHVTAGVIYGSPVREVERLMIQAAKDHPSIRQEPEPFVLFNDFGDNALIFDIYFWVSMNRIMERRIIESDVRFQIDALFREAGIVIAFPQMDVHFDADASLTLQLAEKKNIDMKEGL